MFIVRPEKLRWLLWLRWKLILRDFHIKPPHRTAKQVGQIVSMLVFVVLGLGLAITSYFGYQLPSPANREVLFLVFSAIYFLWVIGPILAIRASEGLDLSKLALFPLSRAELILNLLFTTILSTASLWLLFFFGAIIAGWSVSLPLALFVLLTLLLFYVQIVGMSQLGMVIIGSAIQSRRFRDFSFVFFVLLTSIVGVICQLSISNFLRGDPLKMLEQAPFSPYLQWFPPGMAARAIEEASSGNWGSGFAWLGSLLGLSVLALLCWSLLFERSLSTSESGGSLRSAHRAASTLKRTKVPRKPRLLYRLLPAQIAATTQKDLRYLRRDPQILVMMIQSLVYILMYIAYFVFLFITRGEGQNFLTDFTPFVVFTVPVFAVFSLVSFVSNTLGIERKALATLFLFPIRPLSLLIGKNLASFLIGLTEALVLLLLSTVVSGTWLYVFPALVAALASIVLVIAGGNITSVFFPFYVPVMQRGKPPTTNPYADGGCLRSLLSMLIMLSVFIIIIPVMLAVVLPAFFQLYWVWGITLPLALLYSGGIYYGVTVFAASRLPSRAAEILDAVIKE